MQAPTDADERQLLDAAKAASDAIGEGESPNAAVEKAARDFRFGPGRIRMLAHAVNTGRQLSQFRNAKTAADKFAAFDLADPEIVISKVFPAQRQKAAAYDGPASPEYAMIPAWFPDRLARESARPSAFDSGMEKAAACRVPEPKTERRRDALSRMQKLAQERDEARMYREGAAIELDVALGKLKDYFKQASDRRAPLESVKTASAARFGASSAPLFSLLATSLRGDDGPAGRVVLADMSAPMDMVKRAMDLTHERLKWERKVDAAESALRKDTDWMGIEPTSKVAAVFAPRLDDGDIAAIALQKRGSVFMAAAGMNAASNFLGDIPRARASMVEDMTEKLNDPKVNDTIRGIKAQTMLTQLMSDPDDPISSYDPDEVAHAYNDLSEMAPRAVQQPAVLRPVLRRYLEGNTQAFEAKELGDIEKTIKGNRQSRPSGGEDR